MIIVNLVVFFEKYEMCLLFFKFQKTNIFKYVVVIWEEKYKESVWLQYTHSDMTRQNHKMQKINSSNTKMTMIWISKVKKND